ncbi:MAG: potassium channel protein [Oscillatoriales cyanobacterium RM2_1_1]|nr:potassium channel protein [Oscillatoriales cyanobacterium SM2_3_0]NJO46387.1 potassium channel protein [Oscillatoriales cyanobacterium RM2_1_1]
MQGSLRRVLTGAIFFVITLIVAVEGYVLFGWPLLDSIYMVVITIFGVGYGEVQPLETGERVFTIFVIIAGTSSAVYAVGGFIQMVTEGEINRALDQRRKTRGIENLQDHVIVCGFGRIGQILTQQLSSAKQPFVLVESNEERLAIAESLGYMIQIGNATDETILKAVGIERARVLATVVSDDATNVFITLTARGLNQNLIILARGELPSTEKKLILAGADHVVLPSAISASRMSNLITHPSAVEFLAQEEARKSINQVLTQIELQLVEFAIPSSSTLVGRKISELDIRGEKAFLIVALRRQDGILINHPQAEVMLYAGDTLIMLGHQGDIPQFAHHYRLQKEIRYRGAKL